MLSIIIIIFFAHPVGIRWVDHLTIKIIDDAKTRRHLDNISSDRGNLCLLNMLINSSVGEQDGNGLFTIAVGG